MIKGADHIHIRRNAERINEPFVTHTKHTLYIKMHIYVRIHFIPVYARRVAESHNNGRHENKSTNIFSRWLDII